MNINMHSKSKAIQITCDRNINDRALSPDFKSCHELTISVMSEPCSEPSTLVSALVEVDNVSIDPDNTSSILVKHCNNEEAIESAHAFKESLALAFIKGNLTHVQGNIILETLHTLSHFAYLPRDTRTLLNTPRVSPQVRNIFPGKYLHIGLQKALTRILLKTSPHLIPDILHIDWNTDGARLNKSGSMQIWPIQCLVANVECCKPEIVGIYKGSRKPASIDEFLNEFIEDVLHIIENDSIVFLQKQIPVTLRAFIADAPARSWLLNHFGHTSSHPCSKCRVIGTFYDGQMVSTGIKHRIRTDNEYARLVDDDHHKGPLSRLLLGLVSQVPVEYMHLNALVSPKNY